MLAAMEMFEKDREAVVRLISEADFELPDENHLDFKMIGHGCISHIFQVKLKDNATILVKHTEKDESEICSELHNREIEFYQWMNEHREESKEAIKCPKFHGGYACTDKMGIFLMEDFSDRLCNDLDYLKGFSIGAVLKVVKQLAAIQCLHLSTEDDTGLKNKLTRFDYSSFVRNRLPKMDRIEGLSDEMRSKLHEWIEPVTLFNLHAAIPKDVQGISATLIHCDLWPENLIFGRNVDEIDLLSIIDWQCFKLGNPLLDIASILGVCMTTEQRRAHSSAVLQLYVDEIEKRKGGFKKPFDMTIEKAHQLVFHAFKWACVQLMTAVVTISDEEREENPEEFDVFNALLPEMLRDTVNHE